MVNKTTKKNKQKHTTIYVGHHYTQTNTNNVNKTWALLQTTGGKNEPNKLSVHQQRYRPTAGKIDNQSFIIEYKTNAIKENRISLSINTRQNHIFHLENELK
jgi:hypothetical protein